MDKLPGSDLQWHLDKRIPIATILAILGQAIALGWMASSMDSRIAALERYANELRDARIRERLSVEEASTVVGTQRFTHLDNQLDRLEDKVDKIADKVGAK
jgi:hypothetical protein